MTEAGRILVMGYNAWDVSFPVTATADKDQKCEVDEMRSGGGGPGATAALALARLGADVEFVTVFGDDWTARRQREELEAAGVGLDWSTTVVGGRSPRAVIMVHAPDGERTIYWSRGALPLLDPADVQISWLAGRDLFYTDGHEPFAAAVLASAAVRRGIPVVMDAGSVRPGSAELVAEVTDAVSSREFAPRLTGIADPPGAMRALRARGPRFVAMTFGPDGSLGLDGDTVVHVPAFDVPVVDTTGAGDAFHAGYAWARLEGQTFTKCLEFGSAVAALKCTGWGGREALPDLPAAMELVNNGSRRPIPASLAALLG